MEHGMPGSGGSIMVGRPFVGRRGLMRGSGNEMRTVFAIVGAVLVLAYRGGRIFVAGSVWPEVLKEIR
jgi:hypothetical protein